MKKRCILSLMLSFCISMNMFAMQNDENALDRKLYAIDKASSFAITGVLVLNRCDIVDHSSLLEDAIMVISSINIMANFLSFSKQKKKNALTKMMPSITIFIGFFGDRLGEKKIIDYDSTTKVFDVIGGIGLLSNMAKNICDLWVLFR